MARLFVAVDLPDALADDLAALADGLPDVGSLTFTDPGQAHVTLKFLGDVADDRVESVVEALEDAVATAAVAPFDAAVGGVGAFPSPEYVRVVWVGFRDGGAELTRLHEAIERETTALGFDPEDHEFTPHVTLARMSDARGKDRVVEFLERDPDVGSFRVREVRLKESTLSGDGPTYQTVARVEL